ncbi:MAG: MBL fold metallo-hydrolase, partial [Promethearchaeota archaeon]
MMSIEELKISNRIILLEQKENLPSKFKIKSYKQKFRLMEEKKIPQISIKEMIKHFFAEDQSVPQKSKDSISKIIYYEKERIVMLITTEGKEIIWKRQEFIKLYGWFFFVINREDDLLKKTQNQKGRRKEKKTLKEERTISTEEYAFEKRKIPLKQKINMRSLYRTKEYHQYLNFIKRKKIPQMPIREVLEDFFKKNQTIPLKEKNAIGKLIYYIEEKVIVVKSLIGDKMYQELKKLVSKYGWYFYITGVPVGPSDISIAIDKIEKRFDISFIEKMSLKKSINSNESIDNYIFPVSLKPNHNCHILRLGNVNIMLDCGIQEVDFENIDEFFSLIFPNIDEPILKNEADRLEQIDKSLDFDNNNEDIDNLINHQEIREEISRDSNLNPEEPSIPAIDIIFISHSHFDHLNGLKKLIELYPDVPILCSRITLDLYLLRDSDFLKQETHDTIEDETYLKIIKNVIYIENGTKIKFPEKKCYISFYHAGHMPGALMFMAKIKDYRFLYTGDYTYWDYTPFAGTRKFLEQISRPIDFLLIDSTSAYEEFDNMVDQINSLMLFLEQKAEYEDNCLIGADPSSLAITFMLTIWRYFRKKQLRRNYQKRPNIYVDMMV